VEPAMVRELARQRESVPAGPGFDPQGQHSERQCSIASQTSR
jgi:hypothetical protein